MQKNSLSFPSVSGIIYGKATCEFSSITGAEATALKWELDE